MGPPLRKLSIRKLFSLLKIPPPTFGVGAAETAGVSVAVTLVSGRGSRVGDIPGAVTGDIPTPGLGSAPLGGLPSAGDAAGFARLGLLTGAVGGAGGDVAGAWPNEVSASAVEQKQAISSFFIIEFNLPARFPVTGCEVLLSQRKRGRVEKNFSSSSGATLRLSEGRLFDSDYLHRRDVGKSFQFLRENILLNPCR
jgi:hypothetical protein